MTREEAFKNRPIISSIKEANLIDKYIQFIYDDFESRICENCRYITNIGDWCTKIEYGFPSDYIGGCNKFKPKE